MVSAKLFKSFRNIGYLVRRIIDGDDIAVDILVDRVLFFGRTGRSRRHIPNTLDGLFDTIKSL
ncbi:hypothetical protein J057_00879 [Marinobacter nanhaiticus D15-8W]|uniref:Uncharacterized protein n=1 Tax=Marinobacter nanhaiticus D15-8W TaxID=626887 RepID=N6W3R6_9GAMM|nr:hypothetical protein J057_00879 [Marinobacter nanhaiticus D15-8W]